MQDISSLDDMADVLSVMRKMARKSQSSIDATLYFEAKREDLDILRDSPKASLLRIKNRNAGMFSNSASYDDRAKLARWIVGLRNTYGESHKLLHAEISVFEGQS